MIFYFSGTGNSLHVANFVQQAFGGNLVNIADAVNDNQFTYEFTEDDKAIIVFPVYYGGIPEIVMEFIEKLDIRGNLPNIVGIATCGKSAGGSDKIFAKAFKAKSLPVRAFYQIVSVDNCIFFFDLPNREKALMILKRAETMTKDVIDAIRFNYRKPYKSGFSGNLAKAGIKLGKSMSKTEKFRADDRCTGCGFCAEICSRKIIEIQDGKPVWTSDKCEHCAACINRCPREAIQYGNATVKRNRYVHPEMK